MDKYKSIIIRPQATIKDALRQMDSAGYKTLFVTDDSGPLLGSVTDGDIRRWILKGRNLKKAVSQVMNRKPVYLRPGYSREEARTQMVSRMLECIPVIDEKDAIVSAVWWVDLFESKTARRKIRNMPVVIMAGGEGKRLSPFTHILPKPLVPLGDKPIIEHILDKFCEYGCRNFYLSVNYKAKILKAYFGDLDHAYNIQYIQEELPLGTIGSLYLLKNAIKSDFFVSNCDILIEADYYDMVRFHQERKNDITIVVSMKHYVIPYGICEIYNGGTLREIREKPEYDFMANTGLYIFNKEVIADIPHKCRYNVTDLINDYIRKGNKVGIYPVSEKSWIDIGQWEEMQEVIKRYDR